MQSYAASSCSGRSWNCDGVTVLGRKGANFGSAPFGNGLSREPEILGRPIEAVRSRLAVDDEDGDRLLDREDERADVVELEGIGVELHLHDIGAGRGELVAKLDVLRGPVPRDGDELAADVAERERSIAGALLRLAVEDLHLGDRIRQGPEVAHLGDETRLLAAEPLCTRNTEGEIAHRHVRDVASADVDEDRAGLRLDLGSDVPVVLFALLGTGDRGPGGALEVGEEVDGLGRESAMKLGELGRDHVERRGERGVSVTGLQGVELALNLARVGGRLADDPDRAFLHEEDAEAVAGGAVLHLAAGPVAGGVEPALAVDGGVHAERAVDDEDVMRPRRPDRAARPADEPHRRPEILGPGHHRRHREDEERDHGAAAQEEQELLEPHPPGVLLLGREEEAHRGPGDDLESSAIEEVDDDRNGDGPRANGERRFPEAEEGGKHHDISLQPGTEQSRRTFNVQCGRFKQSRRSRISIQLEVVVR